MLAMTVLALVVNIVGIFILSRARAKSLNVERALRHTLADLARSMGAMVPAGIIIFTGWRFRVCLQTTSKLAIIIMSSCSKL